MEGGLLFSEVRETLLRVAPHAQVESQIKGKKDVMEMYTDVVGGQNSFENTFLRLLEALFDIRDKQETHRLGDGSAFADEVVT